MPTGTSSSEPPGQPVRRPRPGPPATTTDLRRAQYRDSVVRTELTRVRATALAWRNGLGALLAGLVGFGLVKGRSDVSTLADPVAAMVGLLLLLALAAGTVGALKLLHSAHGRPRVIALNDLLPEAVAQHHEALNAARNLRHGIIATLACAALLVFAVAVTWYGPAKGDPLLRLTTSDTTVCGTSARVTAHDMVLMTDKGEEIIPLDTIRNLTPVEKC
ncbi:hypothetical protein [Streptomyces justiciae]|uniref:hypothetical protein n=1 Tax=Streptomyces justiciae TaxID=2780140 RepID=UPI00187E1069|nr:hypothetical protein [Streptomyces justiciae]MBE8475990.1 hypothetical protein [Streptomyces justiciae]MCW8382672.1 hypothetical protein [Streptomyces justiciae]